MTRGKTTVEIPVSKTGKVLSQQSQGVRQTGEIIGSVMAPGM